MQPARLAEPSSLLRVQSSDLELLARTVVEGFLIGAHRSPHSGSSIEFSQYRPYVQGDDPRSIDWRLLARSDRLHVKQFHEETNLRCTVLLDCSASMDYASPDARGVTKFDYARMLTASLLALLTRQKDAAGLIAYHERIVAHLPPRADPNHLRRLLVELSGLRPAEPTDAAVPLRFLGDTIRPRGMVVLVSDLLHPLEGAIEHLESLRARRHDVIVLQVVDPAEETFPFDRTMTLVDAETGREMTAIPDAVRRGYLENRRRHFDSIRRRCHEAEIEIAGFRTDQPLDRALRFFLEGRRRAMLSGAMRRRSAG